VRSRSVRPPLDRVRPPEGKRSRPAGRTVDEEIRAAAKPGQADRAIRAFEQAVALLERERPVAAVTSAEEAKLLAPRSGAVREVLGMALYQAGRFRDALRELQAYRRMTGRSDQNHLIADCHRALGMPQKAVEPVREALRAPLREEVKAEAAIVGASALADLGRFEEALGMLRSFPAKTAGARSFDLRIWYVTGDVLERSGRRSEAAEEFRRVIRHDAGAFDAAERLARLT
jgi:tetratricopeptide (TPR) repeat protein